MKIAITTPTGNIGRKVVNRLLDEGGHELVLLARNPSRLKDEKKRGVTIIKGDLTNSKYVQKATKGVDMLFWINPVDLTATDLEAFEMTLADNATNAIRSNKIESVILLSSAGAHLATGELGPITALHETEERFKNICDNLTILRPSYLMENFLSEVPNITQTNNISLPIKGNTKIPMIATEDVAVAAVNTINAGFTGMNVVPLHGPREYTFDEAANIIGTAVGQSVDYVQVTPQEAIDSLTGRGASRNVADLMVQMYDALDRGELKAELPRTNESTTPTTLENFAASVIVPALKTRD